ncbi:bifunctional 2-polyprenyl-6-hydroxyphenol methylase/3-demethylubiquinol 3-O-methyltransferase UbiG [Kineosporia sp. A_224]|uniref:class I SAM-dependent methyltransferase n=1 Tax=Kineosporia sp. A_224 TaxID=1962180 RepID=UPI000B4C1E24|nr:class I SAM-dependent methyltransferase [Kineosporia sp. A_224]
MTDRRASFDLNRASWDERVPAHAESPDYALVRFSDDPAFLSGVVRFDLPRLGDVAGLDVVHLQCHIGTDTVSLARLGARATGLDFSAAAVEQARGFAAALGLDVPFVEADVHDAVQALGGSRFDLVYTGIGALCWLPDIDRWAGVVAGLLRPGGRLFLREGHPMLWSIDETRPDGLLVVEHPYFERDEPVVWDDGGTYVQTDRTFTRNVTHEWNHGLGEIVTALHRHGLALTMLVEHDSAPWDTVPGRTVADDLGEFRLTDRRWRLPMTYTLQATKA